MKALIEKAESGIDLTSADIRFAVALLISETVGDEDKARFLTALHAKGESADEITAFVELLMERAIDPGIDPAKLPGPMVDVCGTGGDGIDLFNVSTTIMFILAAGGVAVVKHGNRSVTSLCGSADVLEALGVPIKLTPHELRDMAEREGAAFIFARNYHPSFRALAGMRERLARQNQRTIFNLLGPLLNPARPPRQLIGVFAPQLTGTFAEVLRRLGRERAWIVHGMAEDSAGMDDISICGATTVADLENGKITAAILDAQWLGLTRCPLDELRGGAAAENAATITGILSGETKGAKRELAVANAAGGFVVAGFARNMNEGIELAREQLDNGGALKKLRALQNYASEISR
ncbi:MAG: anthranilate phosphoribosyltransferase [Spartobacteria bacterium]